MICRIDSREQRTINSFGNQYVFQFDEYFMFERDKDEISIGTITGERGRLEWRDPSDR